MSRLNAPLSKKRKKSSREKKLQVENHVGWKESNTQSLQRNFKDYSIRAARFETTRSVQNTQMIYWWVDFQRRLLLCYKNDGGKKRNNWRLPVPDCIQDENQWILCSSLKITQTDDVLTDSNNLRDSYTFKIQPTFNLLTVFFFCCFFTAPSNPKHHLCTQLISSTCFIRLDSSWVLHRAQTPVLSLTRWPSSIPPRSAIPSDYHWREVQTCWERHFPSWFLIWHWDRQQTTLSHRECTTP